METDIIAIILASLALIGTCFSYFIHDRKIKKQQAIIQQFEIRKIVKEEEESKKAFLVANVIDMGGGKKTIIVSNQGKSSARNVIAKIPNIHNVFNENNPSPFNLSVGSEIEIYLMLSQGILKKYEIEFEWQDDFNEENKANQTVQI